MTDALALGLVLTLFVLTFLVLPAAIGYPESEPDDSYWQAWLVGMVMITVTIVVMAAFLALMTLLGYIVLWLV